MISGVGFVLDEATICSEVVHPVGPRLPDVGALVVQGAGQRFFILEGRIVELKAFGTASSALYQRRLRELLPQNEQW